MTEDIENVIDEFNDVIFHALEPISEIRGSRLDNAVNSGVAAIISSLYDDVSAEQVMNYFQDGISHEKVENKAKIFDKIFKENKDTSNDYGFYWDGDNIFDKDGNHWYYGDYINDNAGIEPYSTYIDAVKATVDNIQDSFEKDEIADPRRLRLSVN